MVSIRSGWLDAVGPMRLQYRTPSTRENFWCFLDASRSTGMNQFLDSARNVLAGVPSRVKSGTLSSRRSGGGRDPVGHTKRERGRLFRRPWSCCGKPAERASSSKELLGCIAENYEKEPASKTGW